MILSIIIPAYNVETFINDCLESVVNQNIDTANFEIIIINDGSTDSTANFIDNFIKSHPQYNLIYISQTNQGLSASRNNGLEIAKGEYVWFVDSDDWIENNCLSKIFSLISLTSPEIVVLTTIIHQGEETEEIVRQLPINISVDGEKVYFKSFIFPYSGAQFYIFRTLWLKANNLYFEKGIYYEDLLFTPFALRISKRCVYARFPVYNYRLRSNSITTSKLSDKHINSTFTVLDRYLQQIEIDPSVIYYDMVGKLILKLKRMMKSETTQDQNLKIAKRFLSLISLFKYVVMSKSIKNIIGWSIVKFNCYKILQKN